MAQQCEPFFITGTIDDVCFYRMDGKYYARMKSGLTRKRVMKDPAFRRTMANAALLGEASKIASGVYKLITGEHKKHALYREITGRAICMLREGKDKDAVFDCLSEHYLTRESVEKASPVSCKKDIGKDKKACGMVRVSMPLPKLKKTYKEPDALYRVVRGRKKCVTIRGDWEKEYAMGP